MRDRARAADQKRRYLGVSRAELARRMGRVTPSEHNYLSNVLRGESTSEPVVSEVEEALAAIERERDTQAQAGEPA